MENKLDLTLRLGLPNQTVDTTLTLNTCNTTDQGSSIVNNGYGANNAGGGVICGDDKVMINEGATNNNMDINTGVNNSLFHQFAGAPNTLNPMPPIQAPAPEAPPASRDQHVLIDVPARRARRNNISAMTNDRSTEGTKRCSNRNCNAVKTPMWRSGPLGRSTLCNACGIKFKKEETRKAKRDAINDN